MGHAYVSTTFKGREPACLPACLPRGLILVESEVRPAKGGVKWEVRNRE